MTFSRICGIAAIGFVAIVVVATAILQAAGLPATDAEPAVVTAFFLDQTTPIGVASALAPLAWILLALFGAGALARIRPAERLRGEAWSLVGLVGIVLNAVFFGGSVVTQIAMLSSGTANELWHLHNAFFAVNGVSLATALVGFSIGGLRTGTIRTWHAGVGLTAAALQLAQAMLTPATLGGGPGFGAVLGLAGFVLWLIWLAAFGVVLLRESTSVTVAARAVPAAV